MDTQISAPLANHRVLITRATEQAGELARLLGDLGALPEELATIRIAPPAETGPLDTALQDPSVATWWAFTSVNGVLGVDLRFQGLGRPWPLEPMLAAVGAATAAQLAVRSGRTVDVVPERQDGEALARAMLGGGAREGDRVLLPRGNLAAPELPARLRAAGLEVLEVEAYRTLPAELDGGAIAARLSRGDFHWVTFASGSAFEALLQALPDADALRHSRLASIGPKTSAVIRAAGYEVAAEALTASARGLAEAIAAQHA